MHLPKDKRLALAHRILSSVEPSPNPTVETGWDAEIRERICRYDSRIPAASPGPRFLLGWIAS